MNPTITVIQSQPDWLTVTAQTEESGAKLFDLADKLSRDEQAAGAKVIPFRLLGYAGWQAQRVRWGHGREGVMLQLSGDLAKTALDEGVAAGDRVTRLDMAVTVRQEPWMPTTARRAYVAYQRWAASHPRAASSSIRLGSDSNGTFYIGERASERFFRLYDKASESGEPEYANCWRFELECKAHLARNMAAALVGAPDRAAFCQGQLHDFLSRRGVKPIFPAVGGRVLVSGFSRRSDAERSVAWMDGKVMPRALKLSEQGYDDELRRVVAPLAKRLWPSLDGLAR